LCISDDSDTEAVDEDVITIDSKGKGKEEEKVRKTAFGVTA
jgi:hypothetical protein